VHPASPAAHSATLQDREIIVARGRRLEYLTIAWNCFEAAVALLSGFFAGSVALVGFGLDSLIETASALVLLWRFNIDHAVERRKDAEHRAYRIVGVCFPLLAAYVAFESTHALWTRQHAERSVAGILIAVAAVIVMPMLGQAKRQIARGLGSRALRSDAPGRFLRLSLVDSSCRTSAEHIVGLVVGRSGSSFGDAAYHRTRRPARSEQCAL
jgi:divalent metal cation (Fe/Co/Zn/Cd) transporter